MTEWLLFNIKWAIFSHIMVRRSYILIRWWWCLLCTRSSSLKHQSTCRHVDHLNILFYYFSITKKCMTLMQGLFFFDFIFHMIFNVNDINTTGILIMVSSWSYGSWIYNYLCNQCLSPLTLWVWIPLRQAVLKTTLCDKVCQWLATGWWFSLSTPVSSSNKTDSHDITEILLKVALNTINLKLWILNWRFLVTGILS